MAASKNKLKVTLAKSTNRRSSAHKSTVMGLGLRRIGHTVVVEDTPEIRGMINSVSYLVTVENA